MMMIYDIELMKTVKHIPQNNKENKYRRAEESYKMGNEIKVQEDCKKHNAKWYIKSFYNREEKKIDDNEEILTGDIEAVKTGWNISRIIWEIFKKVTIK